MTEPNQAFTVYGQSLWCIPKSRSPRGFNLIGPSTYHHLIACGYDVDDIIAYPDIWNHAEYMEWLKSLDYPEVEGVE